jgi:GNAT superfamily N-acetyltransferase
MCVIRQVPVDTIGDDPRCGELMRRYWEEGRVAELPEARTHADSYRALEAAGVLHALAAYVEGTLAGFLFLVFQVNPHYGCLVASAESYFVDPDYRQSGAGLKLLRAAEALAREHGAKALVVSAPLEGRLSRILPRAGFRSTHQFFLKGLS